jgi:hypothetical protein
MFRQRFGLLGLASLAVAACGAGATSRATAGTASGGTVTVSISGSGGGGSGGASTGAMSGSGATTGANSSGSVTGGTSGTGSTTESGIPGTCQLPVNAPDPPGTYGFVGDGTGKKYTFFKRDDANDRCLRMHVTLGAGAAYGLSPDSGYGVEEVILTSSAADCPVTYVYPFPSPAGQTVEASCGTGSFTVEPAEGSVVGQIVHAIFEFPPTYSWVPASDTYCVVQNCCGPPTMTGC